MSEDLKLAKKLSSLSLSGFLTASPVELRQASEAISRLVGEVEGLRKDARDRCAAPVEAATPLAGQAEKYLALPSDERIWRTINKLSPRGGSINVSVPAMELVLAELIAALSAPPLKGDQGVTSSQDHDLTAGAGSALPTTTPQTATQSSPYSQGASHEG